MDSPVQVKNYKDLKFWQTAFGTSIKCIEISRRFPKEKVFWIIADQLIRASTSIGANIAEGFGRYRGKEYERFLQISLGSANEVEYWLLIIKKILPRNRDEITSVLEENTETIKMLASSLKSLRNKINR